LWMISYEGNCNADLKRRYQRFGTIKCAVGSPGAGRCAGENTSKFFLRGGPVGFGCAIPRYLKVGSN
jgi:hypothetical protein